MEAIRLIERSLVKSIATRLFRQTQDLEPKTPTILVGPGQLGPQNLFCIKPNTLYRNRAIPIYTGSGAIQTFWKVAVSAQAQFRLRRLLVKG